MSAPVLVVRLMPALENSMSGADELDPIEWVLFQDGRQQGPVGRGALPMLKEVFSAPQVLEHTRLILVVPAEHVVLTRVNVPKNQKRQRDKLVPYILEEHINEPIADLFFVSHWLSQSQDVGVAYTAKHRMEHWLYLLAEQGLQADMVLPEHYLLPRQSGHSFALFDGDKVLVRHDHWSASCAPGAIAQQWVAQVVQQQLTNMVNGAATGESTQSVKPLNGPLKIRLIFDKDDQRALAVSEACETQLAQLGAESVQVKRLLLTQPVSQILAAEAVRLLSEHHPFHLLRNEFKNARRKRKSKYAWTALACLFAGFLVLELMYTATDLMLHKRAVTSLVQQNITDFKQAFPEVKRIRGSLDRALRSELARRGEGGSVDFLRLLTQTGASLEKGGDLTLKRLSFDQSQGDLRVNFRIADYAALEQIQESLEQNRLRVDIDRANQEGDDVDVRLKVALAR